MVQYPFIDIAVHEKVRARYARGEALALFSKDLNAVIWANGTGARLFGSKSIYDFIENGPSSTELAFLQMATSARQISTNGSQKNFLMRVSFGMQRQTVQASVEMISLASGESGILFSAPTPLAGHPLNEIAVDMLSGFDEPGMHVAILGAEARVLAASKDFASLGISEHVVSMLFESVRDRPGQVLKRPVLVDGVHIPAAIGAISRDPAVYMLLCVASQDMEAEETIATEHSATPEAAEEFSAQADELQEEQPLVSEELASDNLVADATETDLDDAKGDFVFNPKASPVRFVWKIDSEGRFQEVSGEFAAVVGPKSADINGLSFQELSARYNLDPDGKIAGLLSRRDTWSGKTILWPIENTNLKVPVDLAALPSFSRNREYDGFRGFGIVRVSDIVEDPEALGMRMSNPSAGDVSPEKTDAAASQEARDDESSDWTPPSYEPPVLKIVDTEGRRHSDKVIRLDERRARGDGLSVSERAAFDEIGRQLGVDTEKKNDEAAEAAPQTASADDAALESAISSAEFDSIQQTISNMEDVKAELLPLMPGNAYRGDGLTTEVAAHLPVAMLVHAGDKLIYGNPEFFRLTGYQNLTSLEQAGGIDTLLERDENANPDSSCMILVKADGEQTPVNARLQSLRWEGSSALLLSIAPAVTRDFQKTPEPPVVVEDEAAASERQALRAEIDELHSILETATDGVVILSASGEIRSMNGSALALFNYSAEETVGKPFALLFASESQKAVADYLAGLAGHGVASVLNDGREVIGREASGGFIPLFMTMGHLSSSNGYCAVIRDITQWKRTEEELRTAKRAAETASAHKSDFLASVSHEIRTPLNAIIGFAEMMANEGFGPIGHPRYIEYSNDIARSGKHVLDIVNDLLDISKIEAGQMDLDFAAVGLNEAVSEAVSLLQPQANSERVIIRTSLSQSVPDVVADIRSVKQIAINILANAIKFTPSGGQIVVSTAYESNGAVALRIRDTGPGMSAEELEQALKPFRQVPSAKARKRGDGTGLGLPLTKAMTEANRATFSISSQPNEGTLVEINFPPQRVLAN